MADINSITEDLVINILSRLPLKPLLISKCVSKYWYGLINDANFMKGRSRHMVFLPLSPLCSLEDNDNDNDDTIVEVSDPLPRGPNRVTVLGAIDGVVLLVVERCYNNDMFLYNPLTRGYKSVPDPDPPFADSYCAYGFGYGSSPKDLKVVEFSFGSKCRVFSFEGGSWSALQGLDPNFKFEHQVGTFLNGFVHWIAQRDGDFFIAALDMTKMVFTEMRIPAGCGTPNALLDRTREGCLCMVACVRECCKVDVWVMKEYGLEGSWSKLFSVPLFSGGDNWWFNPIAVLGNWKIVMMQHPFTEIHIYDLKKQTCKKLKFERHIVTLWWINRCIEYVESLVSPSALCPNF